MDDSVFDDLPEDKELAFVKLEAVFRRKMEDGVDHANDGHVVSSYQASYINEVIAAARALDIEPIAKWNPPYDESTIFEEFRQFYADAQNITLQIKINSGRRNKKYSVHLSDVEKQKIRHYIEKIKEIVDKLEESSSKKDAIYGKLNDLIDEIDRDRTRFEKVVDGVRAVSRLSGDVEREGAEPWWKWVKLIFGIIDEAKEKEKDKYFPLPEDRKKIEGPRKAESADGKKDDDEEIPF
ncbi:MAG: hypothetical protein ACK4ZN_06515 [Oceanibaculum sp.]